MKLIAAMKEVKNLKIKSEDLRGKVKLYCSKASIETNVYPDQTAQIKEWIQSHTDTVKQIGKLSVAIQKTNIATEVEIEIGNKKVTHNIAEWIYRRRELAELERQCWACLTDKGIKEGQIKQTDNSVYELKIVRFYDPVEKDKMVELYRTEPSLIDRTLETVNAVTEVVM